MKKIFIFMFLLLATLTLVSCGDKTGNVQGVTKDKILVGNTATTSGTYATVGTPFNQAINAVFDYVNKDGGVAGRKIEFIHYDDGGQSANGISLTEKLIEEDKVFAIVGHFGTWTVAPTVDTIREKGIPMVHAATGVNDLYFENTPGNPVMAIQPIYMTDGRVMTARAVASEIYGAAETALPAGSKVTVFYKNDDAGTSIKSGVELQFKNLKEATNPIEFDVQYLEVAEGTYTSQVAKAKGSAAIILAMNQSPFGATVTALHNAGIKAPIFTSYVNADTTHIKKAEANVGDIYVNGWYSGDVEEQKEYEKVLKSSTVLSDKEKTDLAVNTHAKSGYIAAMSFVEGLKRVGKEELTWKTYIAAMEKGKLDLPLAGSVDYRGGQRIGTDTMSLSKYNRADEKLEVVDTLKTINEILGEEDPGRGEQAQGVTDTKVFVGNTAATSGAFATVGVPFNAGMKAAFEVYNKDATKKRDIEFVTYDDGFEASKGISYTERLVEEDKVFALVGHFGTPTVGATIDYIQDKGVPMVYAATGINGLYFDATPGNPVMAVQPIYKTDGRIMTARALNEKLFGANKNELLPKDAKIALIYTNDDAGKGIREGVLKEITDAGRKEHLKEIVLDGSAAQNAVNAIPSDTKVIIVAANQNPFKALTSALQTSNKTIPVFSSYVNSDASALDKNMTYNFDMYLNAWVDIVSENGQAALAKYITAINSASFLSAEEKTQYLGNSFAIAGYIAGTIFLEGLDRVGDKTLSWENFIDAMEEGPFNVPMGGSVNFANGRRIGIDEMSLLKYDNATKNFITQSKMATLDEILNMNK
ncbi:MAG: ABC transporter substrate-binding protein [Acholeplasma sp.]|nr:ABC transporter substrate-binding protein [Acholeplasma sp.]